MDTMLNIGKDTVPREKHILTPIREPTSQPPFIDAIIIRDGLPYLALHPFTNEEWDALPHVILTGDADWDPGVLDLDLDENETWLMPYLTCLWTSLPPH